MLGGSKLPKVDDRSVALTGKPKRPYIPIVFDAEQARAELMTVGGEIRALPDRISALLLGENLTPLQAQAVLVRVWAQIQARAVITDPYHQPKEKE